MKSSTALAMLIAILIFSAIGFYYLFWERITERDIPELTGAFVAVQKEGESEATNQPPIGRYGEKIVLHAVVVGIKRGEKEATYFTYAQELIINGENIPPRRIEQWQKKWGNLRIFWFKIEPLIIRVTEKDFKRKNIVPYHESYLPSWSSYWQHEAHLKPTSDFFAKPKLEETEALIIREEAEEERMGTMRFKIRVALFKEGNRVVPIRGAIAPGIEQYDELGITDAVTRVTIKGEGDGLVSHLKAFYHLPYLQFPEPLPLRMKRVNRFIGLDSITVILGAIRLSGRELPPGDSPQSVLGKLTTIEYSRLVVADDGICHPLANPKRNINFGSFGVKPGDIILSEDHAGVITEDRGEKGLLDGEDIVLHAYDQPLSLDPLARAFIKPFFILRLKEK
jgi:hypothetical protein